MISGEAHRRLLDRLSECLGPQVLSALAERDVSEVMLNPDGQLFVERVGAGIEPLGMMEAAAAEVILGLVAHASGSVIDRDHPIVSSILPPKGWRIEGILPPVSAAPCFSIRKPAILSADLAKLERRGTLSPQARAFIEAAVGRRSNIVIAGGTGSGKTTLADAVLDAMATNAPQHRLVILEDTPELGRRALNQVSLRTSEVVDMGRLLRSTLRLRPDRIIIGELRDGAALTLLKAWNTGHAGGLTTIHAGSARAALTRLEQLVGEVSSAPMARLIAEAVDVIVVISRLSTGRRVTEIARVDGVARGQYQTSSLLHEDQANAV